MMKSNPWLNSITISLITAASAFVASPSAAYADWEFPFLESGEFVEEYSKGIRLKHTEGRGIGYKDGFTTLDFTLAGRPEVEEESGRIDEKMTIPFVELTGHVFNNGKFATNAGIGLRTLSVPYRHIWGINAFYDSNLNARRPYHQVSIGLEALGQEWELYINAYLPVGKKKSPVYNLKHNDFTGNLRKAREQFSMGGIDAEIGYRFCKTQCIDFYLGLGPYVYWGPSDRTRNLFRKGHRNIIGGRFRAFGTFFTYCELTGTVTYDSRYKWGGQITVAAKIPFDWNGCKEQINESAISELVRKLFQPVNRNEIIVIDKINRYRANLSSRDKGREIIKN